MTVEDRYTERCFRLAEELRLLLGYPRTYFLQMIESVGAVEATRRLVLAPSPSETFTQIFLKGRQHLSLTVEAVIQEPEWDNLCADIEDLRDVARKRLEEDRPSDS